MIHTLFTGIALDLDDLLPYSCFSCVDDMIQVALPRSAYEADKSSGGEMAAEERPMEESSVEPEPFSEADQVIHQN